MIVLWSIFLLSIFTMAISIIFVVIISMFFETFTHSPLKYEKHILVGLKIFVVAAIVLLISLPTLVYFDKQSNQNSQIEIVIQYYSEPTINR